MSEIVVTPTKLPPSPVPGHIPVHLYGGTPELGTGAIGRPIYERLSRLKAPLDPVAFDFVSISMAVTAADTFIDRNEAPDGWARPIKLLVALADPHRWQPTIPTLERALRFLSGDEWELHFDSGGVSPPAFRPRISSPVIVDGCDCACLFSGGLDSLIGALDLIADGRRPVLVSHAYAGDAARQETMMLSIGKDAVRFGAQANPKARLGRMNDVQMRTRSFNFLAMGVLAALATPGPVGRRTLFVPENGLIAINPPLTNRRIGALSTRTTHPHYLDLIQQVLDMVELDVELSNPYANVTKGEMITSCKDQKRLRELAFGSVSCGKWKRTRQQCGRCVPCLIRRASFSAAGWKDLTTYNRKGDDLPAYLIAPNSEPDDLIAMLQAIDHLHSVNLERWVAKTGPLPLPSAEKAARVDVVRRGMGEVECYLRSVGLA